jgi:flagellar motility protein MotE (MotC chaperone)
MVQVLAKVGKILLVLGLIYFALWAMGQFGFDFKGVILHTVSLLPGLHDLPYNYDLGSKRSELWQEKDQELKTREQKLIAAQEKLAADRNNFAREQNQWERDHPANQPKTTAKQTGNPIVPGSINQPLTSDAKIKEYLTMLGKMKPRQAAVVIQKLPEETVFTIFDQLNQYQVIKIMENLPEDYLAKLTQDRLNKYRNF